MSVAVNLKLCSVSVLALALGAPASAQTLTPKDAWGVLESFISGAGGSLTSTGLLRDGDAIVAPYAVLRMGDAVQLVIDELRLEPRGEQVALIPSPSFMASTNLGVGQDPRDYGITHDGALLLSASPERAALGLDFGTLAIDRFITVPETTGTPDDFSMTLTGLTGQMGITLAEPISLSAELRANGMDYDFSIDDPQLMLNQTARSTTQDVRFSLAVAGLRQFDMAPGWVARAFAEGFSLQAEMANGASESHVEQQVMGTPTVYDATVAGSEARIVAADGALRIGADVQGFSMALDTMGVAGTVTLGQLGMTMEMPVIAAAADSPFRMALTLDQVTLAESLLAAVGAQGFAGDTLSAALDLQGDGRWLVEITDDPEPTQIPFDFSAFALNRLALSLGESALTGDGRFALAPGALARAGAGIPEGEGDFVFELRGGNALLGRLAAAGLIPQDQQFVAQMMMNALGRPVGADHLRSEVAIRPGGQLTVNGMPLPF